ncbi:gfo/Idh/MocA family oxidoreductase, partial [Streptomyces sp. SID11233]|nr:gfo/Idh/MocA family oxidoreductase [Streptomyces sp. SID11233]
SAAETRELLEVARRGDLVLRENYMFPQHAQHAFVRTLLADGTIGELRTLSSTFTVPPRPAGDFRHRTELGGGSLLDNGGYPVHVARLFLGDDLEVAGAVLRRPQGCEVDVAGSALLCRPADGATAQAVFGMDHFYRADYHLLGSAGSIEVPHAFAPTEHH